MTVEDWEAKMHDMFSGVVRMPAVPGDTVRRILTDWQADHDKLLARIDELEDWVKATNPWSGETSNTVQEVEG